MVNNAIIVASYQSRDIVKKLIDLVYQNFIQNPTTQVLYIAGPYILVELVKLFNWGEITLLPVNWLYATWGNRKREIGSDYSTELMLAYHYYAGSWSSTSLNFLHNGNSFYYGYFYYYQ